MPNVLTSWKEIAQYLGKGVRTVQRWEKMYSLPVRRATGKDHHAILAIPEELDAWLRCQGTSPHSELESLRREVVALRAENASLKRLLDPRTALSRPNKGFRPDDILQTRGSQLLLETTQLREHPEQILGRSPTLLYDGKPQSG